MDELKRPRVTLPLLILILGGVTSTLVVGLLGLRAAKMGDLKAALQKAAMDRAAIEKNISTLATEIRTLAEQDRISAMDRHELRQGQDRTKQAIQKVESEVQRVKDTQPW